MLENNLKLNNNFNPQSDFLMDLANLDRIRYYPKKTIENFDFLKKLDDQIDQITKNNKFGIFKLIKEKNQSIQDSKDKNSNINNYDFSTNEMEDLITDYGTEKKLIDLPIDILGKILSPLPNEIRQTIYVQRNKITAKKALELYRHWVDNKIICFHVSDHEIKSNELQPGKEGAVFFSTDIKKLFNLHSAKYIYAFRIDKKTAQGSHYSGAPEYFGRLGGVVPIEDSIKIFSEEDPNYRNEVLKSLGGEFDEGYSPSSDRQ